MFYQKLIKELLGDRDFDPRHIEALMRLNHVTLNHLTRDDFREEIAICIACIKLGGVDAAEKTARSFGL